MERSQLFDLMGELKLYGMKAAFDEIMATAVKRQHEPQRIIGDLLKAEIGEKQARSIKYQLTIAKLPLAKDLAEFKFEGTPINQTLVHDLAAAGFIALRMVYAGRSSVAGSQTPGAKPQSAASETSTRPRSVTGAAVLCSLDPLLDFSIPRVSSSNKSMNATA